MQFICTKPSCERVEDERAANPSVLLNTQFHNIPSKNSHSPQRRQSPVSSSSTQQVGRVRMLSQVRADCMAAVGGVGEGFGVADHAGVEDDFAGGGGGG